MFVYLDFKRFASALVLLGYGTGGVPCMKESSYAYVYVGGGAEYYFFVEKVFGTEKYIHLGIKTLKV